MLDVFARRWYIVLIPVLAAVGLAWWMAPRMPERYTAESTLRLHPLEGAESEMPYRLDFADRMMSSYATLAEGDWMLRELGSRLDVSGRAALEAYDVTVDIPSNTDLMRLRVTHPDPATAARAADEAARILASLSRSPARAAGDEGLADAPPGGLALVVFDEARQPERPSTPGFVEILILAGLLGLIAGVGLAVVADRMAQDRYAEYPYAFDRPSEGRPRP